MNVKYKIYFSEYELYEYRQYLTNDQFKICLPSVLKHINNKYTYKFDILKCSEIEIILNKFYYNIIYLLFTMNEFDKTNSFYLQSNNKLLHLLDIFKGHILEEYKISNKKDHRLYKSKRKFNETSYICLIHSVLIILRRKLTKCIDTLENKTKMKTKITNFLNFIDLVVEC